MSSAPVAAVAVVADDSALIALGRGNQLMSALVVAAHHQPGRFVYAPAMCVAAAASTRPELAAHVGGLLAIRVVDLGFSGAAAVGVLIAQGVGWRRAHAVASARPSAEWPMGLPVVTANPGAYTEHGLKTIPLIS